MSSGCPLPSCEAKDEYITALRSGSCADTSAEVLANNPKMLKYWEAYREYFVTNAHGAYLADIEAFIEKVKQKGCAALPEQRFKDKVGLCEGQVFSTLRPFCPETCGCIATGNMSMPKGCPHTCSTLL